MYVSGKGRGAAEGPQGTSPGRPSSGTSAPPHTGTPRGPREASTQAPPQGCGPNWSAVWPGSWGSDRSRGPRWAGQRKASASSVGSPTLACVSCQTVRGGTRQQSQRRHLAENRTEVLTKATWPHRSGPRAAAGDRGARRTRGAEPVPAAGPRPPRRRHRYGTAPLPTEPRPPGSRFSGRACGLAQAE